jgi:hypothetical protein
MKKHLVVAGAMTMLAGSVQAQSGSCPAANGNPNTPAGASTNAVHDVCVQANDVFQFMAPQLGLALAGGNATLGQGGTMGGLGHISVGIRGNVFAGDLPQVNNFPGPRTTQNQPSQQLPSKNQIVGLPVADAAIGIFKGIPLPLTNILGIDALVSATYVPTIGDSTSDVFIKPQTSVKWGYGARLGLLQESLLVPGVSVTYIRRDVPSTDITGRAANATISIKDANVKTSAWRVVASKSLIVFGVAAGIGQDKYDQSAQIGGSATATGTFAGVPFSQTSQLPTQTFSQSMRRTNMFLDLSLNLPIFKLVLEGGAVTGGSSDASTYNTFSSGSAGDSRAYGSVGVRFAW